MKNALHIVLLAVSLGVPACLAPEGENATTTEGHQDEPVGEATQELIQYDVMGATGWTLSSGVTPDKTTTQQVTNVKDKDVSFYMRTTFPALDGGPATSEAVARCEENVIQTKISSRASTVLPWTVVELKSVHAVATISNGMITKCSASYTRGFHFSTATEVLFETHQTYGDDAHFSDFISGNSAIPAWREARVTRPVPVVLPVNPMPVFGP